MAKSRGLERESLVIERPADGNYQLGIAEIDRIWQLMWRPETSVYRCPLAEAVHAQLWMAAPDLGSSPKLLYTMTKEGWARPYVHILLDLVEKVLNSHVERNSTLLAKIFDRETADAFLLADFHSGISIYHEEEDAA